MLLLKKKTEINGIKNDYVTKTSLASQLNNLKTTHITDEVRKVDDKDTKNSSDILGFKSTIEHNKDVINYLEREASFNRCFFHYNQQSYFLFEPKSKSYDRDGGVIKSWIPTGIHNDNKNTDLFSVKNLPPSNLKQLVFYQHY